MTSRNLTANLMTMLLLKRSGAALDRDVIFLAESGEEADPTGVGINFMVAKHFDEIEAEFAITEGGGRNAGRRQSNRSEYRHGGEGARAGAAGRERNVRDTGRCRALDNALIHLARGGGEGGHVADADAAERYDADVLRESWRP